MRKKRLRTCLSWIAFACLVAPAAAAQQPEKPAKPKVKKRVIAVATLGMKTRQPTRDEMKRHELKMEVRVQGQVVTEVEDDGVADKGGITVGDIVLKLGANEVFSQDDIADFLRVSQPSQKVAVELLRGKTSKIKTVSLRLGAEKREAPSEPRLEWQFSSLGQLPAAMAKAKKEKKPLLVGLSGAET